MDTPNIELSIPTPIIKITVFAIYLGNTVENKWGHKEVSPKMIDNAKGAASEEADRIKAQAKSELDQEVVKARNELRDQVSSLVM